MQEKNFNKFIGILLVSFVCVAFVICAIVFNSMANASTDPVQRVSIVEDQENAAFRFMVDGREVARIDEGGLHVRESLEYGGILVDVGTAEYDARNTPKAGGKTDAPQ